MKAKVFLECCFADLFLNSLLRFSLQLTGRNKERASRHAHLNGLRGQNATAYTTGIMEIAGDKALHSQRVVRHDYGASREKCDVLSHESRKTLKRTSTFPASHAGS